MKVEKTRYSFGCGFCGIGGRYYLTIEKAHSAGFKHSCRSRKLAFYKNTWYEGHSKPVTRAV